MRPHLILGKFTYYHYKPSYIFLGSSGFSELRKKNRELETEVTYKTTKLHEWVAQNKELKEENEKSKKLLLEFFRSKSDA